jgi:hypothetical protein
LAYSSKSEDESDMFLRNVGCFSTDYTALYSRRQEFFITTAVRTSNPTRTTSSKHLESKRISLNNETMLNVVVRIEVLAICPSSIHEGEGECVGGPGGSMYGLHCFITQHVAWQALIKPNY